MEKFSESSTVLPEALGQRFFEIYLTIKTAECDRYFAAVPDLDHQLYLRLA